MFSPSPSVADRSVHLAGGGRARDGPGTQRLRRALVGVQVGLTLGLLVAALLLGRSAARIAAPAGFETHGVALLRVRPRLVGDHHRRGRLDGDIAAGVSCQSG
jgi:hypothetical protein